MTLVVLKPPQVFSILRCKPVPEIGLDRNLKLTDVNTKMQEDNDVSRMYWPGRNSTEKHSF